jgi:hypothetical protein
VIRAEQPAFGEAGFMMDMRVIVMGMRIGMAIWDRPVLEGIMRGSRCSLTA